MPPKNVLHNLFTFTYYFPNSAAHCCGKKLSCVLMGISLILCLSGSATMLSGCSFPAGQTTDPTSQTGFYFDTVIDITLYEQDAKPLLDGCFELASVYEKMLSATIEGSDIWNINHADGALVSVNPETYALIKEAISFADMTNGKIDPTIGPLSSLWGFSSENTEHVIPSDAAIENLLTHIDYNSILLDETNGEYHVSLTDTGAQVDLGFIAKGYIADQMKAYLISQDVQSGIINLGGNVLTIGQKPDHSAYTIGVRKPFDNSGSAITTVTVTDKSVVSSGIYERCFELDGTLYHHILDPKTGYPVKNNLLGVTIISDSSMKGDALSTACLILGLDDGMALIESMDGYEALFITDDYEIHRSSGI